MKPKKSADNSAPPRYAVSPINGARVPLGAHPKNTGGKKGRSGRRAGVQARMALQAATERLPFLIAAVDGIALVQESGDGDEVRPRRNEVEMSQRLKAYQLLDEIGQRALGEMVSLREVQAEFNAIVAQMAEIVATAAQPHMPADEFRRMMRTCGELGR